MSTAYANSMAGRNLLVGSAAKYENMTARLGFYLIALIALCSPWGGVLRFGMAYDASDRGVTTVFAIGVILISLFTFKLVAAIGARPRVLFFAAFLFLGMFAGMLQSTSLAETLVGGINRGGYWILMVAVMSLHLSKEKSRSFLILFAVSTTAMSFVSLIDYFHVVDVPRFNEAYSGFRLDPTKNSTDVGRSLIGPFASRSILGPYLALAWPVPLIELIHGRSKNPLKIALWAGALAVLTFAVLVNYSRALYLTVGFAGLYALYTTDYRKVLRILLVVVPLFAILFAVVVRKFPDEFETLVARFTSLGSGSAVESGASWRIGTFENTVGDLLQNPQGMGFSRVVVEGHLIQMHSILTEHLRPAGLLGFILVIVFLWPILRLMIRRRVPAETMVLCAALLGVLAYGLAHSTQNMVAGWIVIGLLYHLSSQSDAWNPMGRAQTSPAAIPQEVRRVSARRR